MRAKLLETCVLGVSFGMVGCANGTASLDVTHAGLGGSNNSTAGGRTATSSDGNGGTGSTETSTGGTKTIGGSSAGTNVNTAAGGAATAGAATGGAATGGSAASGGKAAGGAATGGSAAIGGKAAGGAATAGAATGGSAASGGKAAGGAATGGAVATAGASNGPQIDCSNLPAMPTGGTLHTSGMGGTDNLAWQIWSNNNTGELYTFNTAAFRAKWSNSNNYLGRLGFEWGNSAKTYDNYGTITAQFAVKKTGNSGGNWSYVGMYGWSTNPCIEWYIIDDSFSTMPINPGNCTNMSNSPLSVDGGSYTLCKRNTTGTGGDRCGNPGSWNQYYSIRHDNRTCGEISVTKHFDAWKAAGNNLGNLLEVKVLLEVGGGVGTADFPVAKVMKTK